MQEVDVMDKRTVVLGASQNPGRYAYSAVKKLREKGHTPLPVGIRKGSIDGVDIQVGMPSIEDVHTVSLYLSVKNQLPLYDYILELNPRRIIFNPGAENPELSRIAKSRGIEVTNGCTLVMLAINTY